MLKRLLKKRFILVTAVLFALFLMSFISKDNLYTLKNIDEDVVYVDNTINMEKIYLMDKNNMLVMTEIGVNEVEIETKAKKLISTLIKGGEEEKLIPNGFKAIIPSDTEIKSIHYENNLIKIDFSKELMEVSEKMEEKIIEAIVFTLTSIDGVDNVIIYMEGDILNKLPKSGINLPSTLNKSYGINKEYDINSYKNVNHVTVFYINKYNDNTYYVPVTKYVNDDNEKIKIIVDELASSTVSNTSLMSYLNSNAKLLQAEKNDNSLYLVFNEYIFNDMQNENILEEVIYTISLSVDANYDVKEVVFKVNDNEVYTQSL